MANLSKLPSDLIALVEAFCQGRAPALTAPANAPAPAPVQMGPGYGLLAGLHALAKELGIVRAVGQSRRRQRLALY